ncbi:unnamed protein product [Cylindrotheca closterium]|uniref:Uncharacterized protein n=1 Tax=Cylindrotheca closterium TaxID=2856 RepID=A0AAD2CLM6_9STRA|nr:unnamed protein product [Cylindrotheca closterium]
MAGLTLEGSELCLQCRIVRTLLCQGAFLSLQCIVPNLNIIEGIFQLLLLFLHLVHHSGHESLVESVTPDQAPRTAPTARPPKRDGGTNAESITPSLTDTQGSGSQSDASTPSVFPIFRHPQQSPPSVPVKGKKDKKTSLAGRGASRSTAGQ